MKFYYPGTAMLLSSQVKITAEETRFAFEDYSSALMRRQYDRALEMFREYTFLLCEAKADVYRLKNLTKNLFYNYLIEMEKCQVDIGTMKRAYFSSIDKAENVESFLSLMRKMFGEMQKLLKERTETEDVRIQKIRQYIDEHYMENLEMSALADQFGFSYHYLSSYFNRQAREGFSEYLNKIRVEKAEGLLRDTDWTIARISEAVGYSDQGYFSRVFKRHTGYTPSGYRRKQR